MNSSSMFFALSTGRSGTQTLAHVLTQAPGCVCLHEPYPQMVKESILFRKGQRTTTEVASLLRRSRPFPASGEVYGETNNRLALLVPALLDAFPQSRFIWLQRDGRDVVASELQRGGYEVPSPLPWRVSKWSRWRPRADQVAHVTSREWHSWSRLEKLAWQWDWTHRLIRDDLDTLDRDRFRVLQLEHLEADLPSVANWLGLNETQFVVDRANRRRSADDRRHQQLARRHPNNVPQVEDWSTWSDSDRSAFEARAGALMDDLYPYWRSADGEWRSPVQPLADGTLHHDSAILRAELARMTVERIEIQSELTNLKNSPAELFLRGLLAMKRGLHDWRR